MNNMHDLFKFLLMLAVTFIVIRVLGNYFTNLKLI